jgi:hypothetical protein
VVLGARERRLLVEDRAGGAGDGGGKRRRLLTPQLARDNGSRGGGDEAGERRDREACDREATWQSVDWRFNRPSHLRIVGNGIFITCAPPVIGTGEGAGDRLFLCAVEEGRPLGLCRPRRAGRCLSSNALAACSRAAMAAAAWWEKKSAWEGRRQRFSSHPYPYKRGFYYIWVPVRVWVRG